MLFAGYGDGSDDEHDAEACSNKKPCPWKERLRINQETLP